MIKKEKDSSGYLTEKRRTGQTGKSRKRIFDKFQNSFLIQYDKLSKKSVNLP